MSTARRPTLSLAEARRVERDRRMAAQREAADLRKTLASLLAAIDDRIASERSSFDDFVWGGRPDPAPIRARIEGLESARQIVADAMQRTAKRKASP